MAKTQISEPMSLELFNLWTYIKGRKRSLVTAIAVALALIIQDSELIALIAGLVAEGLFALGDFYLTKVQIKA